MANLSHHDRGAIVKLVHPHPNGNSVREDYARLKLYLHPKFVFVHQLMFKYLKILLD
jgi:hypothetical protein